MPAKHTPGPWVYGRRAGRVYVGQDGTYAIAKLLATHYDFMTHRSVSFEPETFEANARLIAAAPDLLAAAIKAARGDQRPGRVGGIMTSCGSLGRCIRERSTDPCAACSLELAIRKAEGGA